MNVLKSVENAISGLLEGAFGRMFRSEVRPVELARKLAREMDAHREVSLSRTYAPNEYSVWLSPQDRARYEGVEQEVIDELAAYLLEHARQEELVLATPPRISIHTDEQLALGEFGISAQLARPADRPGPARAQAARAQRGRAGAPPRPGEPGAAQPGKGGETMVWSSSERVRGPLMEAREQRANAVLVRPDGRREPLPARGATIGRSRECDIVVDDPGVSRRHVAVRGGPDGWVVEDLGSTNGSAVNGVALEGARVLASGDQIELGSTTLRFDER
ncbi:MAG TPA: DUF3662 and FHA domain-containing protein [Solirubrobacteraceae bacterium]|nr:DUF3662 and FHA domain-containing protein [Solirubrobacteraceae bacterium]